MPKPKQCPKCKSKNIHKLDYEPYSPNNIFGFTYSDYLRMPIYHCKKCKHNWGRGGSRKKSTN